MRTPGDHSWRAKYDHNWDSCTAVVRPGRRSRRCGRRLLEGFALDWEAMAWLA